MKRSGTISLAWILPALLLLSGTLGGADLLVPSQYPTIQDAVDAASNGDTVLVAPGTYTGPGNRDIDYLGKNITVKSEKGPEATIIDCQGSEADPHRGFIIRNGEDDDAVVDGFTITNGYAYALDLEYSGGAIMTDKASDPTIKNNILIGNTAHIGGGAIYLKYKSNSDIVNNIIIGNRAGQFGGGLQISSSDAIVMNNIIAYNDGGEKGGGIWISKTDSTMPDISNNTIYGNTALRGGGIFTQFKGNAKVYNTILWGNVAPDGPQIYLSAESDVSSLTISSSTCEGGEAAVFVESGCTFTWSFGMKESDPLMNNPAALDFHLTLQSPCRDGGQTPFVVYDEDFEGDPRKANNIADIGADEFYPHLYHVGTAEPGTWLGVGVVGVPGTTPVKICLGSGIQDPPQSTSYGLLYLAWPISQYDVGSLPASGVLFLSVTVPTTWAAGEERPLQALIGTSLSNLDVLYVQ